MEKRQISPESEVFFQSVSSVLEHARQNARNAVNLSMVYAYYKIGRMIVEEEQHGENRAAYGAKLLKELSAYLTQTFGKGFSVGNLKNIRQFYQVYSKDVNGETVFSQSETLSDNTPDRKFLQKLIEEHFSDEESGGEND